jgi:hydrogenase small subunit
LKEVKLSALLGDINRRDFLKFCSTTAVIFGLSQAEFVSRVKNVLAATASNKLPVIWLEGQDCAGCTISFAGILNPPVASIILDKLSIRYHETLMAAAGHQSEDAFHNTVKEGGYVLIVEGSIPTADDRFCMIGGRPYKETVLEAASNAAAIIAVGACAAFGGIPAAGPTGAVGVGKVVSGKPIINLPSCPVHPDHLASTVLYYLTTGKIPPLDPRNRPLMFFRENVHDNCRRRSHYENEQFLMDWNDPEQKNWCLLKKGCKGTDTLSDCPVRRWNDGTNFCIDCGGGCKGCTKFVFYAGMSPLYAADINTPIDKINERTKLGLAKQSNKESRKEA